MKITTATKRLAGGVFGLLLAATIMVGCDRIIHPGGGGGGNAIGDDLSEHIGTEWRLVGFQETVGNALRFEELPAGLDYTLTFGVDGRAGGNAECKGYSYAYTTEKGKRALSFSDPAPQIAIACSNPEIEGRFYHGMEGAVSYIIEGEKLVIYHGRNGEKGLHFQRNQKNSILPVEFVRFALFDPYSKPYQLEYERLHGTDPSEKVRIEGDILYAPVMYSGGCEEHSFRLYADSDADPRGAQDLFLIHSGPDDPCEAIITEVRAFDISELRERYQRTGARAGRLDLTIHTLNGNGQRVTVNYFWR